MTIQQVERFIKKIAQKFPAQPSNEENTVLTDIHVRVSQESGELLAFDDDDTEITRCVVEQWIDNKDENFYDEVAKILRDTLRKNSEIVDHLGSHIVSCWKMMTRKTSANSILPMMIPSFWVVT